MKANHKLQKTIYKLAVKAGYPHQLLSHNKYMQVLTEAHKRVYQSSKPINQ